MHKTRLHVPPRESSPLQAILANPNGSILKDSHGGGEIYVKSTTIRRQRNQLLQVFRNA
jgi:hypothetical protein